MQALPKGTKKQAEKQRSSSMSSTGIVEAIKNDRNSSNSTSIIERNNRGSRIEVSSTSDNNSSSSSTRGSRLSVSYIPPDILSGASQQKAQALSYFKSLESAGTTATASVTTSKQQKPTTSEAEQQATKVVATKKSKQKEKKNRDKSKYDNEKDKSKDKKKENKHSSSEQPEDEINNQSEDNENDSSSTSSNNKRKESTKPSRISSDSKELENSKPKEPKKDKASNTEDKELKSNDSKKKKDHHHHAKTKERSVDKKKDKEHKKEKRDSFSLDDNEGSKADTNSKEKHKEKNKDRKKDKSEEISNTVRNSLDNKQDSSLLSNELESNEFVDKNNANQPGTPKRKRKCASLNKPKSTSAKSEKSKSKTLPTPFTSIAKPTTTGNLLDNAKFDFDNIQKLTDVIELTQTNSANYSERRKQRREKRERIREMARDDVVDNTSDSENDETHTKEITLKCSADEERQTPKDLTEETTCAETNTIKSHGRHKIASNSRDVPKNIVKHKSSSQESLQVPTPDSYDSSEGSSTESKEHKKKKKTKNNKHTIETGLVEQEQQVKLDSNTSTATADSESESDKKSKRTKRKKVKRSENRAAVTRSKSDESLDVEHLKITNHKTETSLMQKHINKKMGLQARGRRTSVIIKPRSATQQDTSNLFISLLLPFSPEHKRTRFLTTQLISEIRDMMIQYEMESKEPNTIKADKLSNASSTIEKLEVFFPDLGIWLDRFNTIGFYEICSDDSLVLQKKPKLASKQLQQLVIILPNGKQETVCYFAKTTTALGILKLIKDKPANIQDYGLCILPSINSVKLPIPLPPYALVSASPIVKRKQTAVGILVLKADIKKMQSNELSPSDNTKSSSKATEALASHVEYSSDLAETISLSVLIEHVEDTVSLTLPVNQKMSSVINAAVAICPELNKQEGAKSQSSHTQYVIFHPTMPNPIAMSTTLKGFGIKNNSLLIIRPANFKQLEKEKTKVAPKEEIGKKKKRKLLNRFLRARPSVEDLLSKAIILPDDRANDAVVAPSAMKEVLPLPVFAAPVKILIQSLITKNAIYTEGIFRLSANSQTISEMYEELYAVASSGEMTESSIEQFSSKLEKRDVHECAGLLKFYLRKAKEPVIPFSLYDAAIKTVNRETEQVSREGILSLLAKLPKENKEVIKELSEFLVVVREGSGASKMGLRNLGIVFGPTLLRPSPSPAPSLSSFDYFVTSALSQIIQHVILLFADPLRVALCFHTCPKQFGHYAPGDTVTLHWNITGGTEAQLQQLASCNSSLKLYHCTSNDNWVSDKLVATIASNIDVVHTNTFEWQIPQSIVVQEQYFLMLDCPVNSTEFFKETHLEDKEVVELLSITYDRILPYAMSAYFSIGCSNNCSLAQPHPLLPSSRPPRNESGSPHLQQQQQQQQQQPPTPQSQQPQLPPQPHSTSSNGDKQQASPSITISPPINTQNTSAEQDVNNMNSSILLKNCIARFAGTDLQPSVQKLNNLLADKSFCADLVATSSPVELLDALQTVTNALAYQLQTHNT